MTNADRTHAAVTKTDPFAPVDNDLLRDDPTLTPAELAKIDRAERVAVARAAARRRAQVIAAARAFWIPAAIVVGAVALIWPFVWAFSTSEVPLEVEATSWERTVPIEEWKDRDSGGWRNPPDNAYNIESRQRVRSSTCMSYDDAGWCEWSIDNYDDWWTYTVDEWLMVDSVSTQSSSDQPDYTEPYWPEPPTGVDEGEGVEVLGRQRFAKWSQFGDYTIEVSGDGRTHRHNLDQGEWSTVEPGDVVLGRVNGLGHLRSVDVRGPQ